MSRLPNVLQIWGNKDSMNLNSMILTNIQSSIYFKQALYELKTYHEVVDEIYYRVKHLEPWEKGSRRTQGLTGMCGGVRGVGGGGIVSTAFCILYKLYTLKLTRKQVMGLIEHKDSPYIRALGFMYVRYTQNPQDLFHWYTDYLDDEEEVDVKAGGGLVMTIGQMLRQWLIRLEWFDTLFPRIPIPIQNEIMAALRDRYGHRIDDDGNPAPPSRSRRSPDDDEDRDRKKVRPSRSESRSRSRTPPPPARNKRSRTRSRTPPAKKKRHHRSRSRSGGRKRRSRSRSSERQSSKNKSHSSHHHKSSSSSSSSHNKHSSSSSNNRHHHKEQREREKSPSGDSERELGEIRSEKKERKQRSSRDRS